MSVGPPNVSFVPSERLMIFAPFWAAHRIAWDVLSEDPWPFDPSDRRAITLTCATPAMSTLLSVIAAITPATPVPWYKPDGSLSIGFRSPSMKSYPWLVPSDGFTHMFACKSSWVHQTPVSTASARTTGLVAPATNVPTTARTARRAAIRRKGTRAVRPINKGDGLRTGEVVNLS